MLGLIAAIIAVEKKRTGWAVWLWILVALYVLVYLTESSFTGADFIKAGWLWLIVALCIKKKEPDVVIHKYVRERETQQHNYYDSDVYEEEHVYTDVNPDNDNRQQHRTPKFCSECGAPLNGNSKFCTYCGTKIE